MWVKIIKAKNINALEQSRPSNKQMQNSAVGPNTTLPAIAFRLAALFILSETAFNSGGSRLYQGITLHS